MFKAATWFFQAVALCLTANAAAPLPPQLKPSPAFNLLKPHIARALASASRPFDRSHPDFSSLDDLFAPASLIGIGQHTHGTKEIFQAQADLFIYLVEKHGVRTLLWEDSWGKVAPINDYIQGKQSDLGPLAMDLMRAWRTLEVGNLFRWMRKWNGDHPGDPVDLIGIDIQWCSERTFVALCALLPPDELPKWATTLQKAKAAVLPPSGSPVPTLDDLVVAQAGMEELVRHAEAQVCQRPDKDWLPGILAGRSIVGALQLKVASTYTDHDQIGKTIGTSMPSSAAGLIRDVGMATNVLTLMDNFPKRKFAIFAHSLHVIKDTSIDSYFSMGSILAQTFQDPDDPDSRKPTGTFCTVAFGTRRGTVLAHSQSEVLAAMKVGQPGRYKVNAIPAVIPNSLEGILGRIGKGKDLLVDMRRTDGWLDQPIWTFMTGATMATDHETDASVNMAYNYASGPLGRMFDAYVFLDQTQATTLLATF